MVVRAYAVCIGVTPECRQTESEMIGDGRGCADEADEAYHDTSSYFILPCLNAHKRVLQNHKRFVLRFLSVIMYTTFISSLIYCVWFIDIFCVEKKMCRSGCCRKVGLVSYIYTDATQLESYHSFKSDSIIIQIIPIGCKLRCTSYPELDSCSLDWHPQS